jgi:hypothetical protein
MRAELYLKAEDAEEEEVLLKWKAVHFQTELQDFLEEESDGVGVGVRLPDIIYVGRNGRIIAETRQGYVDTLAAL